MAFAEARDLMVLQRQRRLDLRIGKAAIGRNAPDAPAHGLLELSATRHRFAVAAPRRMRREPSLVVGNGLLDPPERNVLCWCWPRASSACFHATAWASGAAVRSCHINAARHFSTMD
jgi:hypothetical protein